MCTLEGKVAIVTGGGSGLGRAMVRKFAQEGARVLVADLNMDGVAATIASVAASDAERLAPRRVDVTREDDCAAAVAEVMERWGKLDVMVANAGIGAPGFIAKLTKDDFERVLAVNITGVFLCAKYAFLAMQSAQGGTILATASTAALRGTPGLGAYGPSKAAVVQLVKTLALEGAQFNIRSNAICPVWTQTPMVDAFVAGMRGPADEARSRLIAQIPLGRLGRPEDVANAAAYLASEEAAFISGVAFPVDGGSMA
jgi:NAD(P)-dependent dehydrogenase (short-subunit alcohol dehydrogenase family)